MKLSGAAVSPARLLVAMSLLAATVDGQAAQSSYELNAGVSYSDNIRRTSIDPRSDTIVTAGGTFGVLERTSRLDLNASGNLAWYDYLENSYDGELVGSFLGHARVQLIPERFTWTFQDTFGQATLDPTAAVTPDNRENVNYFSTGPDLAIALASETRLRLSGRYSKVTYEDSPLDNQRYSGMVGLVRDLSSVTQVSLDVQRESIRFDDNVPNPDYDRDEAYAHYETRGGRTRIGADLGYSRLEGLPSSSPGGLLARFELSRQVSASSVVTLSAAREFSDSGSSFRMSESLDGASLNTVSSLQSSAPFRNTYALASWNFQKNRTALDLSLGHYKESYEDSALGLDRKRTTADLRLSRSITPTFSAQLGGTLSRETYDSPLLGDFRQTDFVVGCTQRVGRRLSLDLQYLRYHRTGDIATAGYTENRAWLKIRFGEAPPQSPGFESTSLPSDSVL